MSASFPLSRQVCSEAFGTALLVATVVGSGIMAQRLSQDVAVQLLGNTLPTGVMLVVLISLLGPISGAQFNPAVSLVMVLRGLLPARALPLYVLAQVAGGVAGTMVAHGMFDLPLVQMAGKVRSGEAQWFAEVVASFGLLFTILAGIRFRPRAIAQLVGLYITGAYWFTASTSFANPAVTIARSFTDTFSGIRMADVAPFVLAQLAGALLALLFCRWLMGEERRAMR